MTPVVDSHQHYWDLQRFEYPWMAGEQLEPLRRNFLPEDLRPLIDKAGVDRTVFVQTQHNLEENRWVLELCRENDFLAGMVGWVDLASEQCEEQLLEFWDDPYFVGIRHITHDEPDDDFIIRDDVVRGLGTLEKHGVPFDLLFFTRHLRHAPTLAERLPNLKMVIDHLSKPLIKEGRMDRWPEEIKAAARYPNMYCKLSGMVTEADWNAWKPADFKPYVETALEAFGPDRCMFGSDWPVSTLAGEYGQVFHLLEEVLGPISDDERAKIFGQTAAKFYNLSL